MVAHTKHNEFCTTLFGGFDDLFGGITVLNDGFRPTPGFRSLRDHFIQPMHYFGNRRSHYTPWSRPRTVKDMQQDQLGVIFLCNRDCKAYSGI